MCVEQCKLLLSVHSIVGVIDVEYDATRYALKTGTEQIDQFNPMRASCRQHGAFSRRESVGCDIRSVPDTDSRPHAIFKAGSLPSTSKSSQSSWPLAIANIH